MQFCQPHWDKLRARIEAEGLTELVASDGHAAAENTAAELEGRATLANYDPLMAAHWAIVSNIMAMISGAGNSPLYLMAGPDAPEDPVVGYGAEHNGRTWPRCPLCYVNLAHELTCKDNPACTLDRTSGYDFFIDRAAKDQRQHVDELRAGG